MLRHPDRTPQRLEDILEHEGAPRPVREERLLVEGFKREPHDKLEIFRAENGKPLLSTGDPTYVAILTDTRVDGTSLPVIDLNDIPAIADFIVKHCGLKARP
jgi:molybdopterin-guanine dinucleotide biosynthesis protein B